VEAMADLAADSDAAEIVVGHADATADVEGVAVKVVAVENMGPDLEVAADIAVAVVTFAEEDVEGLGAAGSSGCGAKGSPVS
jgi:hypothetical protein